MEMNPTPEQQEAALWLRWPEIEAYFAANKPTGPMQITDAEHVTNTANLIDTHLEMVRAGKGRKWATPYLRRLDKIMNFLTHQNPNT
jgi:hypothetical protein